MKLTESIYSSLRRLLPKPPAIDRSSRLVAPPQTTSLQNTPNPSEYGAIDSADFAAVSAGPSDTAQRVEAHARQASTADRSGRLRIQEDQKARTEASSHPNPKILIDRIRKPEQRRGRGSKVAIACENCRFTREKCTGEVPSCETCLRRGKQCEGYRNSRRLRWQGQVAAARDNIREFSAGAQLQSLTQPHRKYRALAPRTDAWNTTVDQGLQQTSNANCSTLTNEVQNLPLDIAVQYPVQASTTPIQASHSQGGEAG